MNLGRLLGYSVDETMRERMGLIFDLFTMWKRENGIKEDKME